MFLLCKEHPTTAAIYQALFMLWTLTLLRFVQNFALNATAVTL